MGKNNNNEQNAFNTEIHYGKQRAEKLRTEIKIGRASCRERV